MSIALESRNVAASVSGDEALGCVINKMSCLVFPECKLPAFPDVFLVEPQCLTMYLNVHFTLMVRMHERQCFKVSFKLKYSVDVFLTAIAERRAVSFRLCLTQ